MLHALTQYYGLDLLATLVSVVSLYLIGNKNRTGFLLAVGGAALWIAWGAWVGSVGIIIVNVINAFLLGRGYLKWAPERVHKN